jgi:hypothetical protein
MGCCFYGVWSAGKTPAKIGSIRDRKRNTCARVSGGSFVASEPYRPAFRDAFYRFMFFLEEPRQIILLREPQPATREVGTLQRALIWERPEFRWLLGRIRRF